MSGKMSLKDIIYAENLKQTVDVIVKQLHLQKNCPPIYGVCNCGYEGLFEHRGKQRDKDNKYVFSLYICPECYTTITSHTIITNFFKKTNEYKK